MAVDTVGLRKVLELEARKGFADSAVFGGLDGFLVRWSAVAGSNIEDPSLKKEFQRLKLAGPGYAGMSTASRREWVKAILSFLPELERQTLSKKFQMKLRCLLGDLESESQ